MQFEVGQLLVWNDGVVIGVAPGELVIFGLIVRITITYEHRVNCSPVVMNFVVQTLDSKQHEVPPSTLRQFVHPLGMERRS